MLRRTAVARRYPGTNMDVDPSHYYSNFGWSYLMPQGMLQPERKNREASPHTRRRGPRRAFTGVWVDTDMHPVFRVALDPFLRKLAMTRAVPRTRPSEAVADYTKHAKSIGDRRSRHGWLAKVAQLCGMHGSSSEVLPLWAEECHAAYVAGSEVPSVALAVAMCYCTAASQAKEYRAFFECCRQPKWNLTPHFANTLWSALLDCAGRLDDEEGALAIIDEMIDTQVDFKNIGKWELVRAINAVRSKDGYERVKKFLFMIEIDKMNELHREYVVLRSKAELDAEFGETFKANDNMFYHVHWHKSIRNPMAFVPRRLFFDYKPTVGSEDSVKFLKKNAEKILEDRLALWKEQGLVPEDYVDTTKVDDKSEKFNYWARQKLHNRKTDWMKKKENLDRGYTPYEQTQ